MRGGVVLYGHKSSIRLFLFSMWQPPIGIAQAAVFVSSAAATVAAIRETFFRMPRVRTF
jgi:hypothetical protein